MKSACSIRMLLRLPKHSGDEEDLERFVVMKSAQGLLCRQGVTVGSVCSAGSHSVAPKGSPGMHDA